MLVSLQEMLQEAKKEFRNCIHQHTKPDIPEGGYTGGRRYKHAGYHQPCSDRGGCGAY